MYDDGEGLLFVIQQAPLEAAACLGFEDDPHESLRDTLWGALAFNPAAEIAWEIDWTGEDFLDAYEGGGVYRDDVTGWAVAELLRGHFAEGCRVPLPDIVAGPRPVASSSTRRAKPTVQADGSRRLGRSASFKTHS